MKVIDVVDVDFINYKLPSMYIIMPYCSFKCDKESGMKICQNSALAQEPMREYAIDSFISRFSHNEISKAVVFGGLEPLDSAKDVKEFIQKFRTKYSYPIVIYTGYTEDEVRQHYPWIFDQYNLIVKFGRFIPNDKSHYDEVLGVNLASSNQYAKIINKEN